MDFLPPSDGRIAPQLRNHFDRLCTRPPSPPDPWTAPRPRLLESTGSESARGTHGHAPTHGARRPVARATPCTTDFAHGPGRDSDELAADGGKPGYLPLSRTTDRVLRMLLEGDLSRMRAESVAEALGISCTTLRRRLRNDHTSYQYLLDRARQYRCEARLKERWLPGKCLADELGYLEVNSFYRAFRRWTGISYSAYRQRYH